MHHKRIAGSPGAKSRIVLAVTLSLGLAAADARAEDFRHTETVLQESDFTKQAREKIDDAQRPGCECTSHVAYPEFSGGQGKLGPINAALKAFAAKRVLKEFTEEQCNGNRLTYTVDQAGPSLVAVSFIEESECGAYPNVARYGLTFDAVTGKRLRVADAVPESKMNRVASLCSDQSEEDEAAPAAEPDDSAEDDPDAVDQVFRQPLSGALDEGLSVDPKAKSALLHYDSKLDGWNHAMGSVSCHVPAALLKPSFAAKIGK